MNRTDLVTSVGFAMAYGLGLFSLPWQAALVAVAVLAYSYGVTRQASSKAIEGLQGQVEQLRGQVADLQDEVTAASNRKRMGL